MNGWHLAWRSAFSIDVKLGRGDLYFVIEDWA